MEDFNYDEKHQQFVKQLHAKHKKMLRRNRIWLYIGIFLLIVGVILNFIYP
jgi:uncharacterized membrane protein YidH (DUF202 family)